MRRLYLIAALNSLIHSFIHSFIYSFNHSCSGWLHRWHIDEKSAFHFSKNRVAPIPRSLRDRGLNWLEHYPNNEPWTRVDVSSDSFHSEKDVVLKTSEFYFYADLFDRTQTAQPKEAPTVRCSTIQGSWFRFQAQQSGLPPLPCSISMLICSIANSVINGIHTNDKIEWKVFSYFSKRKLFIRRERGASPKYA